jgi:pantoate--beta-alanine ligase
VCQVVDRLLQIIDPDFLFLGQKDYQQCQVIQRLLQLTGRTDITLVIAPTVREADGLAMSSRNLRLTNEQRTKAPALFAALEKARTSLPVLSPEVIKASASQSLSSQGFKVDYFEIADAKTLSPISHSSQPAVALVAAYLDDIRLIDNLPLN